MGVWVIGGHSDLIYLINKIGLSKVRATSGATEVGHYFCYFGQSKVRATSGAT
jgi:hypothetical protein